MTPIECPSPNHDDRDGHAIDMLVLHYTGMRNSDDARHKLCNPDSAKKVSAHYLVDEDGTVYRLVPDERRAWHAGVSYWRGNININQRSIGIEIVNPGHEFGYRLFPEGQMVSVAELCLDILTRHAIPARNVVGHSDVAPERKQDPGELFDWRWLAEQGIGLWPAVNSAIQVQAAMQNPESSLSSYGYECSNPEASITAFQRHFRPKLLNGLWDEECARLLGSLLDSVSQPL
jgi:N-acetylmuramoyl-L-alanine amidase